MTVSTGFASHSRSRVLVAVTAAMLALFAVAASGAMAQTTHLYDHQFSISGDSIPQAVDANGNVLFYSDADHAVLRTDTQGNPVPFSALGTNELDGFGGNNCPATPVDCDRVPSNAFHNTTTTQRTIVAVDNSNGPASGDIYVTNQINAAVNGDSLGNQVEVFASTGRYIGELDQTLQSPQTCGRDYCTPVGITVDANGHIYLFNNHYSTSHVDQYIPQDAVPANDRFVGELQIDNYDDHSGSGKPLGLVLETGTATPHYTYGGTGYNFGVAYRKYAAAAYLASPKFHSVPIDFSPQLGPFGPDYGLSPACNGCNYMAITADQSTEDIYLAGRTQPDGSDGIQEYTKDNVKLGPNFGVGYAGPAAERGVAVDGTNTATRGNVYTRGQGTNIVVFGPPVIIPDVNYSPPDVGHTIATLKGNVGLAGGTNVTDCKVEYGLTTSYGTAVPCDQATPYSSDTAVNLPLTKLFIETTYHYRIVATNSLGTTPGLDQTFHTHAVLDATTDPATNISPGSADLNGTIDADGMDTQYHFNYGSTSQYGHSTPTADAGSGTGDASVPAQTVTGLQSGRIYHFRMVATNALGTTTTADRTFKVATTPKITGVGSTNLTATSADINARINPSGYDTTYRFEYGLTTSYGSLTPATDVDIGSDDADQSVTAHLSDLQAGVTYHFRVVATNKWGTTTGDDTTFSFFPPNCPNAHVRQQVGSNYLPDCRAYEIVSPGNAGGIQLFAGNGVPNVLASLGGSYANLPQNTGYASDPARFSYFGALGAIPGTHAPDSLVDMYVATRTNQGWVNTYPGITAENALFVVGPHCSADMSECYDYDPGELLNGFFSGADPSDIGSSSPYLWNVDGSLAGRLPTNQAVVRGSDDIKGEAQASADFSHYVFSSNNEPFAAAGVIGAPGSVYDNDTQTNSITIVSKLSSGDPIPQSGTDPTEWIKIPAVSSDGSHILMSTQSASNGFVHLYETVDDVHYYDVSKGFDVTYVGSSSDGSTVFFTSLEQITSDDHDNSVDLFMWSEATDSIIRVSQGNGNGDTDTCTTQWDGQTCNVIPVNTGVTTDDVVSAGGAVMFYSPEQLDSANPGIPDEKNLYLYHAGKVQYVSTLDPPQGQRVTRLQLSPDGSKSAFLSSSSLTGYDNTSPDGVCSRDKDGGPTSGPLCEEMFSFDANSGDLKCVSCIPSGAPPNHDTTASASGRFMSDDGRAFFSTANVLDPRDTNGLVDVYEYVEGRPQLISSGTGQQDTWGGGLLIFPRSVAGLEAVSRDGTDVFFSTFDTLVSRDQNGQFLKFYDARTGGGFPDVPPALPCTAADECHGVGNPIPGNPQVGTGARLGSGGNVHEAKPKAKKKAQHKRARRHKRHHPRSKRHG